MHGINFTDHLNLNELLLANPFELTDSSGIKCRSLSLTIHPKDIKL